MAADTEHRSRTVKCWLRQRFVLAAMGFFALAHCYMHRFCLSLAITEMVKHIKKPKVDPEECPMDDDFIKALNASHSSAEFDWTEKRQGLVLSSFFWGYFWTQIPGGMLADVIGGKQVLGVGMFISSLLTVLTPIVARAGSTWLIVLRVFMGLAQGPAYPSLNAMLAHWAPIQERGTIGGIVFAGAQIGIVIGMAFGGWLVKISHTWVIVFYVFGGMGFVWLLIWELTCYNDPIGHPCISLKEREFLLTTSVGQLKSRADLPPIPWCGMLKSIPLWGLVIAQIGHDWGLFTIVADLPKYTKSVMHFTVAKTGLVAAGPYLVMWLVAVISGLIVDWLIQSKNCNVTLIRKVFIAIAALGPAAGILGATYSGCDQVMFMIFLILGMGTMGAFVPSLKVNALDLSPNYAGTTLAFVNGIGAIAGVATPYLVGELTPDSSMGQWRLVFLITVGFLVVTTIFYLVMGSGKTQWWDSPEQPR